MPTAVEIVRRFRRLRALVVGDVMLDTYIEGVATRLCGEGPAPVVRKENERRAAGGAANTAANLRALGASVMLVGVVGRDLGATLLRQALRDLGVDDGWLVEDGEAGTLQKTRVLADGQLLARVDEGETRASIACCEPQLLDALGRAAPQCDVILVSDYRYGVLSDTVIARIAQLRASYGAPLVVDSKALERFAGAGATIVTPNALEAAQLVGHTTSPAPPVDLVEMRHVGQRILALLDTEHVALTMAADGALLLSRDGAIAHIPAYPVAQAHEIGAGDSFAAGLALGLGAGAALDEAGRFGMDAASIVITKRWTAVATRRELLQRVDLRTRSAASEILVEGELGRRRALATLKLRLTREREAGRTVVFTNGVFDPLRASHVDFLRRARALGDLLVVGVNSDQGARRRSPRGAAIPEQERLALVAALDPVDHAILFDDETPAQLIRALRPHIHVKGGDYADETLPEDEAVRSVGGRVVILPLAGKTELPAQAPSAQATQRAGKRRSAAKVAQGAGR
jgi:D-beta-D-heptose 7-phosphate kinase/D-beta-D-heptose 1-phosphate adenosyltransferase